MDFPLRLSKKNKRPEDTRGATTGTGSGVRLCTSRTSVPYCSNSFFCLFDFAGSKLNSFSMKICSYVRNRTERAPVTVQMT